MLHSIVYLSSGDPNLTEEDLRKILVASRKNNQALGITGVLLYGKGAFIQVLEGEKANIDNLYRRIYSDERHSRVVRLLSMGIAERNFPKWQMGFKRINNFEEDNLLTTKFNFDESTFKNTPTQSSKVLKLLEVFKTYNYQ